MEQHAARAGLPEKRGRDAAIELVAVLREITAFGGPKVAEGAVVEGVNYDKKDQYDQIVPWILPGEKLYVVLDCKGGGTGFVAVTNKRLMFYDKAFLGKRKALTSVPFNKITSVSSVDEGRGLFGATSELVVKTGSEAFEFEFRGGDKAQRAYQLIMGELLENEP